MASELVAVERELDLMRPNFEQMLAVSGVPVERLMRSILISCERQPMLMNPEKCSRPSLMASAMSAAALGLEVDGATGQAFIIPFGGRGQLVIGYKGFNTMAARSGFTINGACVHEDDEFRFDAGTGAVHHSWGFGERGKMVGVWAHATSNSQPAIGPVVMGMPAILAVKGKSPGGRKKDSPWNDPAVGFLAMAEKTAKRRLARAMPLNTMTLASALDEAYEERGLHASVRSDGMLEVEGEGTQAPDSIAYREPSQDSLDIVETFAVVLADGTTRHFDTVAEWAVFMRQGLDAIAGAKGEVSAKVARLQGFMTRNLRETGRIKGLNRDGDEAASGVIEASVKLQAELQGGAS